MSQTTDVAGCRQRTVLRRKVMIRYAMWDPGHSHILPSGTNYVIRARMAGTGMTT
jgi:hypothetical protein